MAKTAKRSEQKMAALARGKLWPRHSPPPSRHAIHHHPAAGTPSAVTPPGPPLRTAHGDYSMHSARPERHDTTGRVHDTRQKGRLYTRQREGRWGGRGIGPRPGGTRRGRASARYMSHDRAVPRRSGTHLGPTALPFGEDNMYAKETWSEGECMGHPQLRETSGPVQSQTAFGPLRRPQPFVKHTDW